jgi:pilus assembly protein CpaE
MKIVIYAPSDWGVSDAQLALGQHQVERLRGPLDSMLRQLAGIQADLVFIVSFDAQDPRYIAEVQRLCLAHPQTAIVTLHPQAEPELLLALMRAGVREVMVDDQPATLQAVIERAQLRNMGTGQSRGRIIGFISAKGGDGSSCIAANLAYSLAQEPGMKVLIVDASLPFGDLDMYLTSQVSPQDLADISGETARLDHALLDNMVQHLSPSLDLIPSPSSFEKIVRVEPEHVRQLIQLAAQHYHFVMVDLGSSLDQVGIWVLENIDELCVVSTATLPSVRRVSQLLKLWEEFEKPPTKIDIILNRFDSNQLLSEADIEKTIGRPISKTLGKEDTAIQSALLMGKPRMEETPNCKLSKALTAWSAELSGSANRKKSLWQRLKIK